ncbi:MAG: peptidoglycan editing factor PgeF [Rhodanobacteraceae bacterium]
MATDWIIPGWPAPARVHATVTTRDGPDFVHASPYGFNIGRRCGDDPAGVARNRAFLRDALALPSEPCWLHQVHATCCVGIDAPVLTTGREADAIVARAHASGPHPPEREGWGAGEGSAETDREADAAVTRSPGVVLAIQTADCLPVLFRAQDGSEIAAAHAGWRGLSAGVLEATLGSMRTPREHVIAWLGPAIAAESYEVGDEVRAAFVARDSAAASAFSATRPGHWLCDLYELARRRLRTAGVTRIFGGGFDTFTDPHLQSYRRDRPRSGRMASLIWIDPER